MDTIDWYFTTNTTRFPGPHRYGSLNWQKGRGGYPDGVLGEVPGAPRPWRNGSYGGPQSGASPCGDPSWLRAGVPSTAIRPILLDKNGDPACCSGLPGMLHPAMPAHTSFPPRLLDHNGFTIAGVWDVFNRWIYDNPARPETWFWRLPVDGRARHRDCTWQEFQVNKSPSGATAFLACTSVDSSTGARTWIDPTGVIVPAGQHVTEFLGV